MALHKWLHVLVMAAALSAARAVTWSAAKPYGGSVAAVVKSAIGRKKCHCYSPGAHGPLSVLAFPKGVNRVVIRLRRVGDGLLTDAVRINGKKVGWFIVGTGTNWTVVGSNVATAAHLPTIISKKVFGSSDYYDFRFVRSISVGPVQLNNHAVIPLSLASLQHDSPLPLAGILGGDFWGKMPFTIDYQRNDLILYRPGTFEPPLGGLRYPLRLGEGRANYAVSRFGRANPAFGQPIVAGRVDAVRCPMELDTGWTGDSFDLASGFIKLHPQFANFSAGRQAAFASLASNGTPYLARIKMVTALGTTFTKCLRHSEAFFMVKGERYSRRFDNQDLDQATIGAPILKRYRLTFDYAAHSLWLRKRPHISMAERLAHGLKANRMSLNGQTPLMVACRDGDIRAAKALLKAGANPRVINFAQATALDCAVYSGNTALVQLLLHTAAKSDINVATKTGATALMAAVDFREVAVAKLLLAAGANPNLFNQQGFSALGLAAQAGKAALVRLLLAAGADPNLVNQQGFSALCVAARTGSVALVKLLLAAHAKINVVTKTHVTPLAIAADAGHIPVFKVLLKAGADLDLAPFGYTVLHSAALGGHVRMIKYLLAHANQQANINRRSGDGVPPLAMAALHAHLAACRVLVEAGANVNATDPQRYDDSILRGAAQTDDAALIRFLVTHGAKVNSRNTLGETPLIPAALRGEEATLSTLVSLGANVNARTDAGYTALILAAGVGRTRSVQFLLAHGADVNAVASKAGGAGMTALMVASQHGSPALVKILLRHGALVGKRNSAGLTPLAMAALYGPVGNVCAMLCGGANPNQRLGNDATVLQAAAESGHAQAARDLILSGAKVNARGPHGITALDIALFKGHRRVAKILLVAGANPRLADSWGRSAYGYALLGKAPGLVRLLNQFKKAHPRQTQSR